MNFGAAYSLTQPVTGSAASLLVPGSTTAVAPGIYDHGLVTVLDEELGRDLLQSWSWLLPDDPVALAATWSGDLAFWSPSKQAVFHFDGQQARPTFIGRSVEFFFDAFLPQDGVREKVLSESHFAEVYARGEELRYGQCYIATPWQILGGSGAPETFQPGDLDVYLSLLSQTIHAVVSEQTAAD